MTIAVKRVPIKARKRLQTLMHDYFLNLDAAATDSNRNVAWCTSVGPCEILTAFGYEVYFPENHGAMLGARKISHECIPAAVAIGYSAESCSYMTSDIGSALSGVSPLTEAFGISGPPKPDLLCYNTNQCREVQDWWNFFGRRHNAPVMGIGPPTHLDLVTEAHTDFVRNELSQLITRIESQTGTKMDWAKLEEAVDKSSKASSLWRKVLDTAQSHPSPITFFDGLIHMAPVILMRGSQHAIDYYTLLLAEMNERTNAKEAAVTNERFRIYWDGMPVWPKVREMSEKFFDLGLCVAASTYCNSWAFEEYTGGDPLAWMAKTSTKIFINRDETFKQKFLLDMCKQFDIDGMIFHNARTCPNNTNSRFGMAQRLRDESGLPVLVFDGDLSDVRFFSTAQTMTNIETFVEQLEGRCR